MMRVLTADVGGTKTALALFEGADAQALTQELMGDTMPSNIIMLGACWQRGLVPVSHASLMRAPVE